jgi:hypothetical protein
MSMGDVVKLFKKVGFICTRKVSRDNGMEDCNGRIKGEKRKVGNNYILAKYRSDAILLRIPRGIVLSKVFNRI